MSQARLIINVSDREQAHANGLSGTWTVPGKKPDQDFAMLLVYPTPEIQDIGDQRRVMHWLKATPLAKDIVGLRSDAAAHGQGVSGTKEKWGLLLCEAEPDLPRELIKAFEEEIEYLNNNMPDVKFRKDKESGAVVAVNVEPESVSLKKIELSTKVQDLRYSFEQACRKLVQKSEVAKAKRVLTTECQRLVAEADRMWARPTEQQNVNELHRWACTYLGQERPWCYVPQQLVDCPGCGAKIKEFILSCPHCAGFLDEGREELMAMKPKERAMRMYPERYAEPVTPGASPRR
jgi:hypothetical protein